MKNKQVKRRNRFLAMWDCNGLESLFDISDFEGDAMIAGLKGEAFKAPFNLSMMIMRARFNTQRSYEIYTFETEEDINYNDVIELFKHTPQVIVDAIRKNGNMIHSDYSAKQKVIS